VVFKEEFHDFLTKSVYKDAKEAFANYGKRKKMDPHTLAVKVADEEVSKIEFIAREVIHALKAHDISNKMLEMARAAIRQMNIDLSDDEDNIDAVMEFNAILGRYIRELFAAKK
jgi:hypothetical protein